MHTFDEGAETLGALEWERALELFLDARTSSVHTCRAYRRQVREALIELGISRLAELDAEALAGWRARVAGSGLAPASQAQALAALRSFLKWTRLLAQHELSGELIEETLRTPRWTGGRPYAVASEPEIRALLVAAEAKRDRAIAAVLVGSGLRAGELVGLDVGDLYEDERGRLALHVRAGKGRRERVLPVGDDVAVLIRRYLASTGRTLGDGGPLFLSRDPALRRADRRLSTRAIGFLVGRLCRHGSIVAKRVSPHSLRHTFAIRCLRASGNVVAVQKLLGHQDISTTAGYLDHLELDELRAAIPPLPRF